MRSKRLAKNDPTLCVIARISRPIENLAQEAHILGQIANRKSVGPK